MKKGRIQGQEFYIDLTEENFLKYLKKGSLFCAGGIPEDFLERAGKKGIRCFDYQKDPFTAMENTIATAEGAIAQAILRSPENLRGSSSLVIGYGRWIVISDGRSEHDGQRWSQSDAGFARTERLCARDLSCLLVDLALKLASEQHDG